MYKYRCIIITVSCLQIRWLGFYRRQIDTTTENPRNPIIHVSFLLLRSNHDYLSRKQCTYYPSLHKLYNTHFYVWVKFEINIMASLFRVYYFSSSCIIIILYMFLYLFAFKSSIRFMNLRPLHAHPRPTEIKISRAIAPLGNWNKYSMPG